MIDLGNWFPVIMISAMGLWYYVYKRDKKRSKNQITGELNSNTPVVPINPKFVEAATRMIECEEEPTKEFVNEVIKLIKVVLSEHSIQDDTFGYIYPWYLLNINRAEFRFRIYKDYFILKKGTKETTSKLNKDDITQALKQIGVLKGMRMKKTVRKDCFFFFFFRNPSGFRPPSLKSTGPGKGKALLIKLEK